MNIVVPLVIATAVFSTSALRTISVSSLCQLESKQQILIASNDLPSDPYDPPIDRGNPHGGNPHGGDPHDENHDPDLPSNKKELERKNPDPNGQ